VIFTTLFFLLEKRSWFNHRQYDWPNLGTTINAVGKKAEPSRDFRSSYAQKLASWKPWRAPRNESNTKRRDRLHGTRGAETDQEAPRDEIDTGPKQR